ncbi:MAG: 8-amino-7-oxononanoate synthase [bacterium]
MKGFKQEFHRTLKPCFKRRDGKIYIKGREYIDFSSNDYLGLSSHPRLKEACKNAVEQFGIGCCASRLLSGDYEIHHMLEEEIAKLKEKEKGLVFNSGYQANLGIISAICDRESLILADRFSHASIIDGAILSSAHLLRFKHNDIEHLESLLKKNKAKNIWVVTESVFSMDGDKAILSDIVSLKERYNFKLLVDEAHATGIFGRNGEGLVGEKGLSKKTELIMGTFSKALGGFGGYVVGDKEMIDFLINKARSFIYSTGLPPCIIAGNLEALKLLKEEPERRKVLLENAKYLRKRLLDSGFLITSETQIIPIILKEDERAIKASKYLCEGGFWALPIRPPTVLKNTSRIRLSLSFYHKKGVLDKLVDALKVCGSV